MTDKSSNISSPVLNQVKTFKLAPLSSESSSSAETKKNSSEANETPAFSKKKKKLPSNKVVPLMNKNAETSGSVQTKETKEKSPPASSPSDKKTKEEGSINNNLAKVTKKIVKEKLHKTVLLQKPNFSVSASEFDSQMISKNEIGRAVDLSVRLLRISDMKEESHSYYCEFLLFLMWKDPDLIGKKQSEIDWNKAWRPRITVVNMISAVDDYFSPRSESCPVLIGKTTGQVLYVSKINGTISNRFDLHDFPYDMQRLTLVFRSKDSFNKVYIRKMTNFRFSTTVAKNYAAALSHWTVGNYAYEEAQIDNHSLNRPYAVYVTLSIFFSREC